jgi:hypothetical protein
VVGIVVSLVALSLALLGIEWARVGRTLRRADWRYLVPGGAALLAYLLTRSIRWRILLGPEVRLIDALAVTNIGYLISNVLPFRLGDPARAVAIGLRGHVRVSAALSTVVVERVLDMLAVVTLLAVTLPAVGEAGWTRRAGLLGGSVAVAAMAVFVTLALRPEWGRAVVRWMLARLPGLDGEQWLTTVDGLLEGLDALRSLRQVAGLLIWSGVTWALTVGYYWALLGAFLPEASLVEASFLTCATGLGVALPSSPGAVGVFHSVARYALQLPFDVPGEKAIVVAFASHAFQYTVMCLLGVIGLVQQNLSLGQLQADATATLAKE